MRKRYEHIVVAEELIGRKLLTGEMVHHKNRIPSDNRPENLQVMTRAEHSKIHGKDRSLVGRGIVKCEYHQKRKYGYYKHCPDCYIPSKLMLDQGDS